MTPEARAQWQHDAAVMRDLLHLPAWEVYKRHVEGAVGAALVALDSIPPSDTSGMIHWRAVRKGFQDALGVPDAVIRQAEQVEATRAVSPDNKPRWR